MERDEDCRVLSAVPLAESLNPLTDSRGRAKGEEEEESPRDIPIWR
jgi:hypothetical protein